MRSNTGTFDLHVCSLCQKFLFRGATVSKSAPAPLQQHHWSVKPVEVGALLLPGGFATC